MAAAESDLARQGPAPEDNHGAAAVEGGANGVNQPRPCPISRWACSSVHFTHAVSEMTSRAFCADGVDQPGVPGVSGLSATRAPQLIC
eukprot:9070427-Pyramimonas_sp.AAC.1